MRLTRRHAMTSWRHGVMTQIARNVCHQLEVLWKTISRVSAILWVDRWKNLKIILVTCTVDLVGQDRLTNILTIPISVISLYRVLETGPPSANPGPWAEASRALSYRAVTGPYYVDNVDIRGPAGPCRALPGPAGPLKIAGPLGFCPPCPPPSRRAWLEIWLFFCFTRFFGRQVQLDRN